MRAPVRHTCPDIDRVIKDINNCREIIQKVADELDVERMNTDDPKLAKVFQQAVESLEEAKCLADVENTMEDLRNSNDILRTWGYELLKEIETA